MRPLLQAAAVCLLVFHGGLAAAQQDRGDDGYLALWNRGDYREALDQVERRMAMYEPNRVPAHMSFHHGELLFATGKVEEAIEAFKEAIQRYPEPEFLLALAEAHKYCGQTLYYDSTLKRAAAAISGRWGFSVRPDNLVAVGRIHELTGGQNPKTLLNTYYGQVFERYPSAPEVYVGAAEMALRYNGYALATKHFAKALELDQNFIDALAGLCETYRATGDAHLESTLQRLAALNPNHPRLLAIQAEVLLDVGLTAEAHEILDRGLAINPLDLRLLSLKSGAYFLEFNDIEMKAVQEKVLDFNPLWAQVYEETGRIASRHYRFTEGLEFQRLALEIDPKNPDALAEYTLNLMRLGREDEGRAELERAFDAHPYNVSLYNLLQLMDSLQSFEVIENDDIVLKLPKAEAPVLAEDALDILDEAIALYEKEYEITLQRPILIEMFDDHDDFMVRSVGLPGSVGHLGICFGQVVTMDTPSVRAPGSSNWHAVLWHEFVHVITLQKTKNRMERWLSEGISVFEENRRSEAWHNPMSPNFAEIIAETPAVNVQDITNYFIKPKSPGDLMFGYFIAAEFVSFYVKEYGFAALVDALQLIAEKTLTVPALTRAADTDLTSMNEAFAGYLRVALAPYGNLPKPQQEPEGLVQELANLLPLGGDDEDPMQQGGSPFTDAMERARKAVKSGDTTAAEKALLEAHDLFPDYTAGDAPLRQLAELYEREGRQADLVRLWERMIQWTPTELAAARGLMRHAASAGEWDSVLEYGRIATGIDPYAVETRRALVEGFRRTAQFESALSELAIVEHLDAARAPEHSLLRVELLRDSGRPEEAREAVIRLLEQFPHYWEAQKMLLNLNGESVERAS